jgi:hypothetical protein
MGLIEIKRAKTKVEIEKIKFYKKKKKKFKTAEFKSPLDKIMSLF